jgi:hypothetical protein
MLHYRCVGVGVGVSVGVGVGVGVGVTTTSSKQWIINIPSDDPIILIDGIFKHLLLI